MAETRTFEDGSLERAYLDLLKRSVTGTVHQDIYKYGTTYRGQRGQVLRFLFGSARGAARQRGWELTRRIPRETVEQGVGAALVGESMVGLPRLDNIERCISSVIADGVPGDLIETGVWKGGSVIFMKGVLKAHGVTDRTVYVADSFQGLPPPDEEQYPQDTGSIFHEFEELAVSVDTVRENFRRYGLLDDKVKFLEGWFKDTLPTVSDVKWSVVRLDGDMYESTMDSLTNLYPNLSPGGYLIIDDGAIPQCRRAVDDFRAAHGISEPIEQIDHSGLFWRRGR